MIWHVVWALTVAYLLWRIGRLERRLVRSSLAWHEAANRAMRRYGRDRWKWRELDAFLRYMAMLVDPSLDVPDVENGPPDDPESG